jgi:hypothetical protein
MDMGPIHPLIGLRMQREGEKENAPKKNKRHRPALFYNNISKVGKKEAASLRADAYF